MDVVGVILAGLVGTAAMTALLIMAPRMGMPKMDIIGVLGSMFTSEEGTATRLGLVIHFMMGVIFAIIYALLWNADVRGVNVLWGLIFGAVHGAVVSVVVPMMLRMHPRPPHMEGGPMALVGLLMGHMA